MKKYITQLVAILVSSGVLSLLYFGVAEWINQLTWIVIHQRLSPSELKLVAAGTAIGAFHVLLRAVLAALLKYFIESPPKWYTTYVVAVLTAILNYLTLKPTKGNA